MRLFRRPSGPRLFFATDLHGSERCFRKWLNAAGAYKADVLILGGDVTGKAVVPVVENGQGWIGVADGREFHVRGEEELAGLRARIRDAGHYDVVVTKPEAQRLEADETELERVFHAAVKERLRGWVKLAEERLEDRGTRCFMMLGNDDPSDLADVLRDSSTVVYAEDDIHELPGEFELLSYGYSPPTPWNTPRELPDYEIGRQLDVLGQRLRQPERAVFNVHCPPRDTHLDQAPELDADLRIKGGIGGRASHSVGSQAVRDALGRFGVMLGLHGHVHESPAAEKLGRTICINPGSEYSEGILRGALVQLGDKGVESWQLVQG